MAQGSGSQCTCTSTRMSTEVEKKKVMPRISANLMTRRYSHGWLSGDLERRQLPDARGAGVLQICGVGSRHERRSCTRPSFSESQMETSTQWMAALCLRACKCASMAATSLSFSRPLITTYARSSLEASGWQVGISERRSIFRMPLASISSLTTGGSSSPGT